MEVIVGKMAGFCGGITNAVNKTDETLDNLEKGKKIYCLGELAHNRQVMERLEKKGLIVIEEADIERLEEGTILITRAHGVVKQVYEKAEEMKLKVIDLACPKVIKIHDIAKEYAGNNYYIFLIGENGHPEIIGTESFCGECYTVVADKESIDAAIEALKRSGKDKLLVIAQTTFNLEKFYNYIEIIKRKLEKENIEIEIKNTICDATRLRQEETDKLSKQVEYMIIIGGKKSSNTRKLYDISYKNCSNVVHVETKSELDLEEVLKYKKIGIMAGASTPKESIDDVIHKIKEIK